ncbi:MAG TPA: methylenetetrahydrofolate reductase [Actinomycetota bacterium]|nr:methylenetetrahydrofolate reductase [Actinomycetota bacterium]
MSFRLIYEIAVPREPDLVKIRTQIEIFGPVVDAILVPDNHLGQAALSSVAVALEVRSHGFRPIVAINARDRNELRLRSDLITLRTYDIDEVLFVRGDKISDAKSELTVRKMLDEPMAEGIKRGVTAVVGKSITWRSKADFLFTQLAFGHGKPGYWREAHGFPHPLYCGVIGLPNQELARKFLANIPGLQAPPGYLAAFERDGEAGFSSALKELEDLRSAGVDGAHLVVPARWRRFAELLTQWRQNGF